MDEASVTRVSEYLERVRRGIGKTVIAGYQTNATSLLRYTNELQQAFPVYSAAKTPLKLKPLYEKILNIFTSKTGTIYDSRAKASQKEREKVDPGLLETLRSLRNVTQRMADHSDTQIKSYGSTFNVHAT